MMQNTLCMRSSPALIRYKVHRQAFAGVLRAPRHSLCRAVEETQQQAEGRRALPVPSSPQQQVEQAICAVEAAWRAGVRTQRVEILLPLIGATDLDDWPGGVRQQFKAASPLVEQMLRGLKQREGLQGPLTPSIWDDGDAVAAYVGERLACVVFPTAAVLDRLRKLTADKKLALVIIVNPQWDTTGTQFVDFGILPWQRKAAEELIGSFQTTYSQKELRVYGDSVRVLRAHPGQWQVHLLSRDGSDELLTSFDSKPSYKDIEELLRSRPTSMMNMPLVDRLQKEWQFNQDSLNSKP